MAAYTAGFMINVARCHISVVNLNQTGPYDPIERPSQYLVYFFYLLRTISTKTKNPTYQLNGRSVVTWRSVTLTCGALEEHLLSLLTHML